MLCDMIRVCACAQAGAVTKESLQGVLQGAIEKVVLTQSNGSLLQRILAEYLSTLVKKVEAAASLSST